MENRWRLSLVVSSLLFFTSAVCSPCGHRHFRIVTTINRSCPNYIEGSDNCVGISCRRCEGGNLLTARWYRDEVDVGPAHVPLVANTSEPSRYSCGHLDEPMRRGHLEVKFCSPPARPVLSCVLRYRLSRLLSCVVTPSPPDQPYCRSTIDGGVDVLFFFPAGYGGKTMNRFISGRRHPMDCRSDQQCQIQFSGTRLIALDSGIRLVFDVPIVTTLDGRRAGLTHHYQLESADSLVDYYQPSSNLSGEVLNPTSLGLRVAETHWPSIFSSLVGPHICRLNVVRLPDNIPVDVSHDCFGLAAGREMRLWSLQPSTNYRLSLTYRLESGGIWSENFTLNFSTPQDVPRWPSAYPTSVGSSWLDSHVEVFLPTFPPGNWNGPEGEITAELVESGRKWKATWLGSAQLFQLRIPIASLPPGVDHFRLLLTAQNDAGKSATFPLRVSRPLPLAADSSPPSLEDQHWSDSVMKGSVPILLVGIIMGLFLWRIRRRRSDRLPQPPSWNPPEPGDPAAEQFFYGGTASISTSSSERVDLPT